ncbi:MAG: hypothetical protein IKU79_02020 [Bacteroidaceae bacterium]|nr:hypothetical protein [Bacteroidaceae bacterium]
MKKIIILLVTVFALSAYNTFATNNEKPTSSHTNEIPKCEFTLDHYTGIIRNGCTNNVTVQLNCPQEKEVSANVFVYVNKELVASKVFTIPAGKKASDSPWIGVSSEYNGMKYTLEVR